MAIIKKVIDEYEDLDFSDIHIREGKKLAFRYKGKIIYTKYIIDIFDIEEFLNSINQETLLNRLDSKKEIDFAFEHRDFRYRGNIFLYRKRLGITIRKISMKIKSVQELGLPESLLDVTKYSSGIVFITGPTGSGKTTSLAALIEYINLNYNKHIITIEDPIEYIFESKSSLITQREISLDSHSFSTALKSALRQDPDIIIVGEVRDEETIKMAIRAAETGHLCFCTLHTLGAAATVERIIAMFPSDEKEKVKYELSLALRAIVSQSLILIDGELSPLTELLIVDKSVCNMIKENKTNQISNYIETNISKGMLSMDRELIKLYEKKKISKDQLESNCIDSDRIRDILSSENSLFKAKAIY